MATEKIEFEPIAAEPPAKTPTLKAGPLVRKPTPGGGTQTGLRPGLKLPTQNALRPGLKLPTKPGAGAMKPGLKLPTKPVIRKPGTATQTALRPPVASAAAAPKPMEQLKAVTQKMVTQNLSGITGQIPQQAILHKTGIIADQGMSDAQKQAAKAKTARISLSDAMGVAPVKNENAPMKTIRIKRPIDIPGATSTSLSAQPKSKTLTTPVAAETPAAPAAPAAPATPAAPVSPKVEAPVAAAPAAPAVPAAPKPTVAAAASAVPAAGADKAASPTITQRKTLKIARPGGGAVRPNGKFGVKRPSAPTAPKAPAAVNPAGATANPPPVGGGGEVADIADIPDLPMSGVPARMQMPVGPTSVGEKDVPKGVAILGLVVQIAACIVIGFLGWYLYQDTQLPAFCGGCQF